MKKLIFSFFALTCAVCLATFSSCSDEDTTVAVTGVTVSPQSHTLAVGGKVTLTATVAPTDATDKSVVWSTGNAAVATVSTAGEVTAVTEGTAVITATSTNGVKGTCTVTVQASVVDVTGITVTPTEATVAVDSVFTLTAEVAPADATNKTVIWTSSDPDVATVADGVVTALAPGTTTITAIPSANNEFSATCVVTVELVIPDPAGVWTFEDPSDLYAAAVGEPISSIFYYDWDLNDWVYDASGLSSIDGPNGTKAVQSVQETTIEIAHGIAPNGGGSLVNEYTIMADVRFRDGADFEGWFGVYEPYWGCSSAVWIRTADWAIGYEALGGYSAANTVKPDTWQRLVISAKAYEPYKIYLDGELAREYATFPVDDWVFLYDIVTFGYDSWGYPGPDFAEIRIWGEALTAAQVKALGVAGEE
jgi:hypothetical protein